MSRRILQISLRKSIRYFHSTSGNEIDIIAQTILQRNIPNHPSSAHDFASKLLNSGNLMSSKELCHVLFDLQRISMRAEDVNSILRYIANEFISTPRSDISPFDIANAMYGIQNISCSSRYVKDILTHFTLVFGEYEGNVCGQDLSYLIYGLKSMTSNSKQVLFYLNAINRHLTSSKDTLTIPQLCHAFLGLQNMTSDSTEVRSVVRMLWRHLSRSSDRLNTKQISEMVFSLRYMTSTSLEVRGILKAVSKKMKDYKGVFSAEELVMLCNGLKHKNAEHSEVRLVLTRIMEALELSFDTKVQFSNNQLGSLLMGLHGMGSHHKEVLELLTSITKIIQASNLLSTPQASGSVSDAISQEPLSYSYPFTSVYALSAMTSNALVVKQLMVTLAHLITSDSHHCRFNGYQTAMLMSGLCNMNIHDSEVRILIQSILPCIQAMTGGFVMDNLTKAFSAFLSMDLQYKETEQLLEIFTSKLEKSIGVWNRSWGSEEVTSALYSLQRLNLDHASLSTLSNKLSHEVQAIIRSSDAKQGRSFSLEDLSKIMFALIHTLSVPSARWTQVMVDLCNYTNNLLQTVSSADNKKLRRDFIGLLRTASLVAHHGDLLQGAEVSIQNLISTLQTKLNDSPLLQTSNASSPTLESKFYSSIKSLIDTNVIDVDSNCVINGFELDVALKVKDSSHAVDGGNENAFAVSHSQVGDKKQILHYREVENMVEFDSKDKTENSETYLDKLRHTSTLNPLTLYNFELDGPSHYLPKKRYFCYLRDIYLQEKHGVEVVRVKLPYDYTYMVKPKFDKFVRSLLIRKGILPKQLPPKSTVISKK